MSTDLAVRDEEAADEEVVEEPKKRRRWIWVVVAIILLGGAATGGYVMGTIVLREETPLPLEAEITDLGTRYVMIPSEYLDMRMPQRDTISADKGKDIFAQCSVCHGATGKGDAPWGRLMYPPAADLTAQRTQTKSDGQLYWLIAHGMNLTGMPAWGEKYTPKDCKDCANLRDDDLWSLVAYIRTLNGK